MHPMSSLDTLLTELDGRLLPESLLASLAESMNHVIPFDLMGVAALDPDGQTFEVVGATDAAGRPQVGARFAFAGTVGGWVASNRRAFVGTSREQVRTFPATYADFQDKQLESNCVLPLKLAQGTGVIYFVSSRTGAYSPARVEEYEQLAEALTPAIDAAVSYLNRSRGNKDETLTRADGELNLDGVQRRHITRVLEMTSWVIEGPYGAAAALGLAPSTLRHRMRKLGVARPTGAQKNGSNGHVGGGEPVVQMATNGGSAR